MRRLSLFFILFSLSCHLITTSPVMVETPTQSLRTSIPFTMATQTVTASAPLKYTTTRKPTQPFPEFTPTAKRLSRADFKVQFHPAEPLRVGDLISVEVIPLFSPDLSKNKVYIEVKDGKGNAPYFGSFTEYGISKRTQVTLTWFWDTSALPPGQYILHFSIEPDGPEWNETVNLLQSPDLTFSLDEPQWMTVNTDCCKVSYISGTSAERDLEVLLGLVEEQASLASQKMRTDIETQIEINFIPRVWGHGGFASSEIVLSYLDRNYTGGQTDIILHHELIHILDRQLGDNIGLDMLIEGMAVYQSGGHYKKEPLLSRAAALLPPKPDCLPLEVFLDNPKEGEQKLICGLDSYIPVQELNNDFYTNQHEIGYILAGSLLEYMIGRWGWEQFSAFYRNMSEDYDATSEFPEHIVRENDRFEASLIEHFSITLSDLESDFIAELNKVELNPQTVADVYFTILYYDTVRRYQKILDPAAYFAAAWSPNIEEMRHREIVADYLRHPEAIENLVLESMFTTAHEYFLSGEYPLLNQYIQEINATLDLIQVGAENPFDDQIMISAYYEVIKRAQKDGYQVQDVRVMDNTARLWVGKEGSELRILDYFLNPNHGWQKSETAE